MSGLDWFHSQTSAANHLSLLEDTIYLNRRLATLFNSIFLHENLENVV